MRIRKILHRFAKMCEDLEIVRAEAEKLSSIIDFEVSRTRPWDIFPAERQEIMLSRMEEACYMIHSEMMKCQARDCFQESLDDVEDVDSIERLVVKRKKTKRKRPKTKPVPPSRWDEI